jgi:hypothetical protein
MLPLSPPLDNGSPQFGTSSISLNLSFSRESKNENKREQHSEGEASDERLLN